MTTEIERQFFDTFGIEPEEEKYCLWECKEPSLEYVPCNKECKYQRHDIYYPTITDRILLKLICILNPFCYPSGQNIQHLKESVLDWCITFKDDIGQQVQALFSERGD